MWIYISLAAAICTNIFLIWYIIKLLRKFFFISETLSNLYVATKTFSLFVGTLYGMDSYYGEPMIEELVGRIREVNDELEEFREIFEYTLDYELEEELNAREEEKETRL